MRAASAGPTRRAEHGPTTPGSGSARVNLDDLEPSVGLDTAIMLLAGTVLGTVVAVLVLPGLLPDLAASLLGDQPKAFWYVSRSAGVVGYLALWLSMVLGLSLTNRLARLWGGGPTLADLHQFTSLLALAMIVVHVVVLLGDPYIGYRLDQLVVPFASAPYEPFWVGLGQIAVYVAVPVTFSFWLRRLLGTRTWRAIHYGSFAIFVLAVAHGLGAGTDTSSPAMLAMYVVTGGSVLFLTINRIVVAALGRAGASETRTRTAGRGFGTSIAPSGSRDSSVHPTHRSAIISTGVAHDASHPRRDGHPSADPALLRPGARS